MHKVRVALWNELADRQPAGARVANVDLVIIRYDDEVSVLYGRCHHRGALLADGRVEGENLYCGVHNWDYRFRTGISEYNNSERLHLFSSWIDEGEVQVDEAEIRAWEKENPQPFRRDAYQGDYADIHPIPEEGHVGFIQHLAEHGLSVTGHHGPSAAMGVPRTELPSWDDIQFLTAQLATPPHLEDVAVDTELIIGPGAKRPLSLAIPIFVSDMSFGALSREAKTALSKGADLAGTGICSGEGGMLPDEQAANGRYFYELASGRFGYKPELLEKVQAFHFKGGQGAKTGTGGHLPGNKVTAEIGLVRGLEPGTPAISPPRFPDWDTLAPFQDFAAEVRERTGGIPVGFKLSAQHIEDDIDAALKIGVDYIILDGRGGGTGSAPLLFRNNISVPTIAAIARARRHLDASGATQITLIATGGLRTPADFCKAMALGADGVAIANSAMQAIGCIAMRACNTNNCPVGIATQKDHLRARLVIDESARRLYRFLESSTELMKIMARACGHRALKEFTLSDITTWKRDIALLAGVPYGGVTPVHDPRARQ